jgi:transposase
MGMSAHFIEADRETFYLLPPSIQDWLQEKHLARFVVEIVSQLDLQPIRGSYSGGGSKAYSPEILLALLFYGYATGVFGSRQLERATYESIAFRYITANTHPDHDTIANFRKRFLKELESLFLQILLIAHGMGVLKLGKVSLDGTKVKANASKHHALSWEHACKLEQQLKAEVEELLKRAERADEEEIPDGMSIPDELSRRGDRLKAIAKAKAEIEARAVQRYQEEKEAYDKKVQERREKEEKTGKKARGRNPEPPEPGPRRNDQINLTDKESRIMPITGGGFEQAYNAQASVDIDTMLIVENHISQCPNDKLEIETAMEGYSKLPEELGNIEALVADSGYFSEANIKKCKDDQIVPYITPDREKHNQSLTERFSKPEPLPDGANEIAAMRYRLKTSDGRQLYAKRKSTVEPVFGIIKAIMGFRQFLLRRVEAVGGEWKLVCIAWNLKRLYALSS